jgi:hypothetical protein
MNMISLVRTYLGQQDNSVSRRDEGKELFGLAFFHSKEREGSGMAHGRYLWIGQGRGHMSIWREW